MASNLITECFIIDYNHADKLEYNELTTEEEYIIQNGDIHVNLDACLFIFIVLSSVYLRKI